MPITVSCAGCKARLNAPDAAAGKRVKCPKCGGVIPVPAPEPEFEVVEENDFEVVEEPPDAPPAGPAARRSAERPRKPVRRRDDDDDDEEYDRPRKKKGKNAPPPGVPVWVWAAAGVAALLVVAGGVYVFVIRKPADDPKGPVAKNAAAATPLPPRVPPGWITFDDPGGLYSVPVPGTPTRVPAPVFGGQVWEVAHKESKRLYRFLGTALPVAPPAGQTLEQSYAQLLPGFVTALGRNLGREVGREQVTFAGGPGWEIQFNEGPVSTTVRLALVGSKVFVAIVARPGDVPDPESHMPAFFDGFRPK